MGCKRIPHYPKELKKEIIQKLKDGISRSDIQKEYGISPSSLSRWMCPPDEIIGNANEETVRRTPIQPIPVGERDDDNNDDNDNDDDDEEAVEDWNRVVNKYKALRKGALSSLSLEDWKRVEVEYNALRKKRRRDTSSDS